MAIYAIGDLQGCYDPLMRLLDKIRFNPADDQLWFCGDLVNRGPDSLKIIRFIKSLNNASISVLGNHDLHLLAVSVRKSKPRKNSLYDILVASDRDELLDWIRHLPLMYQNSTFCLVHAGLPPQWDLAKASLCAQEVEKTLRGQPEQYESFLMNMYGDTPRQWSESLEGWARLRFIVNCFTRMRYCDLDGYLNFDEKNHPGSQSPELYPWYSIPGRLSRDNKIIFGHWSTLGFHRQDNCVCIDTGCLWGGELTAIRLDDDMFKISVDCPCYKQGATQ